MTSGKRLGHSVIRFLCCYPDLVVAPQGFLTTKLSLHLLHTANGQAAVSQASPLKLETEQSP